VLEIRHATRLAALQSARVRLTYGARIVIRYHGSAAIRQGPAEVEGDCIIESVGDPSPGPDPSWSGILQEDPAPKVNLVVGVGAWLRLADGRECEIQVERADAGSGVTEFTGARGILDLH
jgi:hypothetical protein